MCPTSSGRSMKGSWIFSCSLCTRIIYWGRWPRRSRGAAARLPSHVLPSPFIPIRLACLILLIVYGLRGCAGRQQKYAASPADYPVGYVERGYASWYGPGFHGKKTASGEVYDSHRLTAAHRTLPLGTVVQVRSLTNGRLVTVRINDRGPFVKGRIIDLSLAAAQALAMAGPGTDQVELRVVAYSGHPGAWGSLTVPIASFVEQANAQALARKLTGKYPDVRIVPVALASGRHYRGQVGQL